MKPYPKYKPSDIQWLGDIPEHWEVKKLKYIGESIIGIIYSPNDIVEKEEGILVLRSSNVQKGILAFEDCVYVKKELPEKHLTQKGDILICARNGSAQLVGKCAFLGDENIGLTFGAFMTIFRSSLGKYLYYFFNSSIFKSQTGLFTTTTINQLTSDTLNNMTIAVPTFPEQTAIAQFLDQKTAQIDTLIAQKQRLISLLKEERMAFINEILSDESFPLKKLKYVVSLKSGSGITSDVIRAEGQYPVFGGNGLRGYYSDFTHDGEYILIGRQGALCGNINYTIGKFWASEHAIVVTILDNSDMKWLGELLRVMNLNQYSVAAAQPGLSVENIINLKIPYPSITKQIEISKSIRITTGKIDATLAKIVQEIELLKEYRVALISEVVTGKISVI